MRSRPRSISVTMLILSGLSAALAACSTGGYQQNYATGSLGPKPELGMDRSAPRTYPDGSYNRPFDQQSDNSYAPRRYTDPGTPTPRQYASAPYANPQGYGSPTIQTGSLGPSARTAPDRYDPNARWASQQPSYPGRWQQPQRPLLTTGSLGAGPQMVDVREGDTLYALSRRHNVPVGDIVAANRLTSERIAVGQRLVIPTRYR